MRRMNKPVWPTWAVGVLSGLGFRIQGLGFLGLLGFRVLGFRV
jgi:4-amino-4-deoxy-L-arabinose transferase-like glycosyltransferase